MKLSSLFGSAAPNKVFIAIVLGGLAGLAYSLVIPIVLLSLQPELPRLMQLENVEPYFIFNTFEVSTPKLAIAFFLLCIFILVCRTTSESLLTRLAVDVTKQLRKSMYRRISQLPIQDLDRIGASRLMTALTIDIPRITNGAAVFPDLVVSISTLVGLLSFLIYLNLQVFIFIVAVILAGAITYQIPMYMGRRYLLKSRNKLDYIYEAIRGLIYGAKELKINQQRQQSYLKDNLNRVEDDFSGDEKNGQTFIVLALNYGNLISFFTIGFVAYVMVNYYALSLESLTGIIMVMLYITGPISAIANSIGPITQASVALKKLQCLQDEMPVEKSWGVPGVIDCNEIHLKDVSHTYSSSDNQAEEFFVGPINLSFKRGEVTFLVGGNGSGKTTLSKLLSLHYIPQSGSIFFDNHCVIDDTREACRQSISAIYTDFYLFTKLFGVESFEMHDLANQYIQDLHLDGKVKIVGGAFSGTALSDGQKKRLALLVTYLENRSIYIFDEWAADQDPVFKDIFYRKILPSLKSMNKLVIVISHDDRYFDAADKVVIMDRGVVSRIDYKAGSQYELDKQKLKKSNLEFSE
jgi:putative ATP-binding cassette transporter